MARNSTLIELTPADIDGRYDVEVTITPELPQDRMVKAQLVQAYRTPGADGKPFVDDLTLLSEIAEFEHPDLIRQRIDAQLLASQDQTVAQLIMAARRHQWMAENKDMVKAAEAEGMVVMTPEQFKKVVDLAAREYAAQMAGQGGQLAQMMALADQQAGMPGGMPGGMGPAGATPPAPPAPNPAALPSQVSMTPDQGIPELDLMVASQERRGKPVNPPY